MSTNTLLKVDGNAWSVRKDVERAICKMTTSSEIVSTLGLDYTVSAHNLVTDVDDPIDGYWGMYRDDTEALLGLVKSNEPTIIQNVDTFTALEPLMENGTLTPLVVDSYLGGKQLFGCFQFNQTFDVLEDSFNQYFIAVNDHLKPDGNLSIISTPVRIACMNIMSHALSKANLKFRIPGIVCEENAKTISAAIMNAFERTAKSMQTSAKSMTEMKISRKGIEKLLDELFPYIEEQEEKTTDHTRANQTVDMQREAFITCLAADNLANYEGTMYQVFNALTDYATHYHRNADKAFNLEYRMNHVPGMNPAATTEMLKVSKFINNMKAFAEAA